MQAKECIKNSGKENQETFHLEYERKYSSLDLWEIGYNGQRMESFQNWIQLSELVLVLHHIY